MKGLQAIHKRSKGLSQFVESFKSLSKIPEPVIGRLSVNGLFNNILTLMKKDIESHRIHINSNVILNDLEINADEKLIEQVLINLLKNDVEAGKNKDDFKIELSGSEEMGNVKIEISDNGPCISSEVIDNIFVPFFTTKKDGSGIGLSLSKQILRKHGGNIEVISKEATGATFTVTL